MRDTFLREGRAIFAFIFQQKAKAAFALRLSRFLMVLSAILLAGEIRSSAQGTAFTYQGRLFDTGQPANGNYDMTFALFNASQSGSQVGNTLTNLDTIVTNGLFTVQLNFGPVFNGNALWLQIGVRTNGASSFASLSPLQALTPTPYAITASNALTAASVMGSVSGNGVGLTNLNASQITAGTINETFLPPSSVVTNGASAPGEVPMWTGSNYVWASAGNVYSNMSVTFNSISTTNLSGTNMLRGQVSVYANRTNELFFCDSNGSPQWGMGEGWWAGTYQPIAYIRADTNVTTGADNFAFDLIPDGGPTTVWEDICDTDGTTNNFASGEWLELKKYANGYGVVELRANGTNSVVQPLVLQYDQGGVVYIGAHEDFDFYPDFPGNPPEVPAGSLFNTGQQNLDIGAAYSGTTNALTLYYADSGQDRAALYITNNAAGKYSTLQLMKSGGTVWVGGNLMVNSNFFANGTISGNGAGLTNVAGISGLTRTNLYGCTTATNVCAYSVPSGVTNTYDISGWINVTSVAGDVIAMQVIFTDENNVQQTVVLDGNGVSSASFSPVAVQPINCKGGTTITVQTVLTTGTGTITYNTGARIAPEL